MGFQLQLYHLYRLANGDIVIAMELRTQPGNNQIMVMTKVGDVPGYHHCLDGSHHSGDPDYRVVSEVLLSEEPRALVNVVEVPV